MSRTDAATALREHAEDLARQTTARHLAAHPDLEVRYGDAARGHCTADGIRHLQYLATAVRSDIPAVFAEYVAWARSVLDAIGIPEDDLRDHLATLGSVVTSELREYASIITPFLADGMHTLEGEAAAPEPSHLEASRHPALAERYLDAVLSGHRRAAVDVVTAAFEDQGIPIEELYLDVFQPALREVGRQWQLNRVSIAQEHFATAATQLAMSTLYPHIFRRAGAARGRLLAVCVGGELHEVGLRMVADVFELHGWDTHFVGANVPMPSVLSAVQAHDPDVIALSVTLSPHVDEAAELIEALRARGHDQSVIVGGRPFLQKPELQERIGADGTATDARAAVALADGLLS